MVNLDSISSTLELYNDFYTEYRDACAKNTSKYKVILNDDTPVLIDKVLLLILYTMDQFKNDIVTTDDLKNLHKLDRDELVYSDIANIAPGAIPLFIFKQICNLKGLKISFDSRLSPFFKAFAEHYGPIIRKLQ